MRKPAGFIVFVSAVFLLIGSIGVNVFLHTCEEDGTFVSYFVPAEADDHCAPESSDHGDPCCADDSHSNDDDCCGDEQKHFQIKLDYFQKVTTPFIGILNFTNPVCVLSESESITNMVTHQYANPPPDERKVARSRTQVWII